jgi:hypothetical protein
MIFFLKKHVRIINPHFHFEIIKLLSVISSVVYLRLTNQNSCVQTVARNCRHKSRVSALANV